MGEKKTLRDSTRREFGGKSTQQECQRNGYGGEIRVRRRQLKEQRTTSEKAETTDKVAKGLQPPVRGGRSSRVQRGEREGGL